MAKNTISFDLQLADHFTDPLNHIQHSTRPIIDDIERRFDHLRNALNIHAHITVNVDGLDNAQRKMDRLGETAKGLSMGVMLGNLATNGAMWAGQQIVGLGKEVLNLGMGASATRAQFGVLAGEKDGAALYGNLTHYIEESVFGPELYQYAKTMMANGIATKDVMPVMKMIGDVAMGDAEKMGSLTLAFSQTSMAGKLMGQDLIQYVSAGFNPLQVMAEHTGKKVEELKDQMSEGKITADMVRQSFEWATGAGGKFHGMLDKMAQTPFGKWQAVMGSLEGAKMEFGENLLPLITPLIDGFAHWVANDLPKLSARLYEMIDYWSEGAGQIWGSIKELLAPIGELFMSDGFKTLVGDLMSLSAEIVGSLIPAMQALSKIVSATWSALPDKYTVFGQNETQAVRDADKHYKHQMFYDALQDKMFPVKDYLPEWGKNLSIPQQMQLADYVLTQYGGKKAWMDSDDQRDYYLGKATKNYKKNSQGNFWNGFANGLSGFLSLTNPQAHAVWLAEQSTDLTYDLNTYKGGHGAFNPRPDVVDYSDAANPNKNPAAKEAVKDAGESIVGGGKRAVVFNIKSMIGEIHNHVANMAQANEMTEKNVQEWFLRLLMSIRNGI
jgi:tape measure domain-containing protein